MTLWKRYSLLLGLLVAVASLETLGTAPAFAAHFPWDQAHDTFRPDPGDDDNDPGDDSCPPNTCCLDSRGASPVELASGNFVYSLRTVRIGGLGPEIDFTLTYNSRDNRQGPFGHGWTHQYDQRLIETTDGVDVYAICTKANGKRERFLRNPDGSFMPPAHLFDRLTENADGTFSIRDHRGMVRRFDGDGRLAALVDRNGNTATFEYDETGFMTRISDAAGRSVVLTKGSDGRVASITDSAGRVLQFGYDTAGNLVRFANAAGQATTYQYDAKSNLTAVIDPRGNALTRLTYDTLGRVRTHVDGAETWTYEYLPASRRTIKRDSQNRAWTLDYNAAGVATRRANPLGGSELYVYDANLNVTEHTDERGNKTRTTYDLRGNPLAVTDAAGNRRTMTWDPVYNQMLSQSDARGNVTSFEYDARGNLVKLTDPLGSETQLSYDAKGQMIRLTDPMGGIHTFTYDVHGNLSQVTDPLGNVTSAVFDLLGKVVSTTDDGGSTTQYIYDEAERLAELVNAEGQRVQFSYDASGNLENVTLPNGATTAFAYDALNRMVRKTDPLGRVTTYTYDRRSKLASQTTPKGDTIQYVYDVLDRLVTKVRPEDTVSFSYDAAGNPLTITDADSSLSFIYDVLNRTSEARTAATAGQVASRLVFTYDAEGNRATLNDSIGGTTAYVYDSLSRLTRLTNHASQVFTFSHDRLSNRTTAGLPEGLSTTYSRDAAGRLVSLLHRAGIGDLTIGYTYDGMGNRTSRTDGAGTHAYSFDTIHQLTAATHPGGDPESYVYDVAGNRVSSHLSAQHAVNAANQLLADDRFDYAYDANGNLIRKTDRATLEATSYQFDSESQLVRIDFPGGGVATYRYDGVGRRIEKNVNGQVTRYIYDGPSILLEYAGSTLSARYTQGPGVDEILAVERGGVTTYFQSDAQRSVVRTVGSDGSTATLSYDTFGRITDQDGNLVAPYAFQGREYDAESGLYYFRARYYDPSTGRFVSEDPIGFAAGINFYAFVRNNPVTLTDPSGLSAWGDFTRFVGDVVTFWPDAFGADKDFWDNYQDMRDANTIGADKYFHCKANCEAASRGAGGDIESSLLSEMRELFDEYVKGDPPSACNADRAANDHGRRAGRNNRNVDCSQACNPFRPNGLDPKY